MKFFINLEVAKNELMKNLLTTMAIVGCISVVNAQVTDMGGPLGWKGKIPLKEIPTETMPGYDQTVIDAEDAIDDLTKDHPWRFGYKYQVDYDLNNSGKWTTLPNGDKVWQLAISCPGALTVNLLIDQFSLPTGAYLYLYDTDQTNRVGAYTQRNNRDDGLLGTELVHGDEIIVEYYEPAGVQSAGSFRITDVVHGYRSLKTIQDELLEKALNSSGDCNIDVNCPLGSAWGDQIRSVAMIVVGGSGICSGALINNTCDDGTPYFLTADHCLGSTGNWAFRFNWETPLANVSCATTSPSTDPGPPYDQTANGATILANSGNSDFALLEIDNMTVTDAQNWNLFYAGWDNSDATTVTSAVGVHHPSGDVKKICLETDAPYHSTTGGAQVWWIDSWEQGVTEPGSSGSPLFDQNGRIIGQLYGGLAACSGTTDNNQYDFYGRFGVSWGLGASTYLAPGGCGSGTTNNGWDPNAATVADDAGIQTINDPTGLICASSFDPEVVLRNYGTAPLTAVTINYDIDAGPNNVFNWTGNLASGTSVTVALPTMASTSGPHTFNASTSLPNGNADPNTGNDAASGNFTLAANAQNITLTINTDCWGSEVSWEIQDVGNNTLVSGGPYTDVTGGETIVVNTCLDAGCYDFIINDSYGDGMFGSQYPGCTVNGDYTIEDASMNVLATIQAANSDYGAQEINNFCVGAPCGGTVSTSSVSPSCFGGADGSITVSVTGGDAPFTYNIGSGPQGAGTFAGLTAGPHTITIIDNSSCTNTVNITLTEPAAIVDSYTTTDEISGMDGAISLTMSGGTPPYTYSWSGPNSFTSGFEDPSGLEAGSYNCTVTDGNGCTHTINGVEVGSQLSFDEVSILFNIFPNPSNGVFQVQLLNTDEDVTVSVTDITGRLIFSDRIAGKSLFSIDISEKAEGTYFLQITDGEKQTSKPIIYQK